MGHHVSRVEPNLKDKKKMWKIPINAHPCVFSGQRKECLTLRNDIYNIVTVHGSWNTAHG